MINDNLIPVDEFCVYHNVAYTFIEHLQDAGLVKVTVVNQINCIPLEEIRRVERLARIHSQLQINEAGVVAIDALLQKMENLQQEMSLLRSRLRLYES